LSQVDGIDGLPEEKEEEEHLVLEEEEEENPTANRTESDDELTADIQNLRDR